MDLNKVLDKELAAWLVEGEKYEVGEDKEQNVPARIVIFKGFNKERGLFCFTSESSVGHAVHSWYLAKIGIKKVVEDRIDEQKEIIQKIIKEAASAEAAVLNSYLKHKVLEEVNNALIYFEHLYNQYYPSMRDEYKRGKSLAWKESYQYLERMKEKINDL